MCYGLSGIQRLTPARTLPGPDLSESKTCIATCMQGLLSLFFQAAHLSHPQSLSGPQAASLPTPHHVHGVPAPGQILQY